MEQLREATISLIMPVRPSVRMELGWHWTDLRKKWVLRIFTELCRHIPIFEKSRTKPANTLHEGLHNSWLVTFHTVTSAPTFSLVTKFTSFSRLMWLTLLPWLPCLPILPVLLWLMWLTLLPWLSSVSLFLCCYSYVNAPEVFLSADITRTPHSGVVLNSSELK